MAAPAPVATRLLTFLIADLRGYTSYTAEHGDEAAARLTAGFANLAQDVVGGYSGEVIELRGDEVLAIFSSARQALRAAVDLNTRFSKEIRREHPVDVGIGLDVGDAVPVKGGYRSGALNLAARLQSLARGQVFASETVVRLAGKTEGISAVDRGEVTVKGLTSPTRVFQVAREGELPATTPPLQPKIVAPPVNLPDDPTPFIGREREIDQVTELLREPDIRMVTLTGPGGTGKTRLALRVGMRTVHDFTDGVQFVLLASLTDSSLVPSAIATAIKVSEEPARDRIETLIQHLRDKRLLLILDNYEHLLDASSVVARLLDDCRGVHVLITSRTPLHLIREHEYLVPPLSVPDPAHLPDLDTLSRYEAVALFLQQARRVRPDFHLTDENAPAIAAICARLDGLPLAVELAAARIKLLPPQALLQRLSNRMTLLTGGARDRPARQQSLRGAIDWSYSLLTEEEQTLFAQLSVFAGGWTLEAAEAVCGEAGVLDILEGMASLVDKSLVREEGEVEPRFSMLETVREYALERLTESNEEAELRRRHAAYFLSVAEAAMPDLHRPEPGDAPERLEKDHDNFRGALRWTLDRGEVEMGLRLVWALGWFWTRRGYRSEARGWIEQILTQSTPTASRERTRVLRLGGGIASMQGDDERARAHLEEALRHARTLGDAEEETEALEHLAVLRARMGQYDEATAYWEDRAGLARAAEDGLGLARYLDLLGYAARLQGQHAQAAELLQESLDIYRRLGHEYVPEGLMHQGLLAVDQGDTRRAARLLAESVTLYKDRELHWPIAFCLEGLARIATTVGDAERAARLWGAAETLSARTGFRMMAAERAIRERFLSAARGRIGETVFARAWEEGQAMDLDDAIEYALRDVALPR